MAVIDLYEDNAGGLYLRREGEESAYAGLEYTNSSFTGDAAELADDAQPPGWNVPVCSAADLDRPETRLVASWEDGNVSFHADAVGGGEPGRRPRIPPTA